MIQLATNTELPKSPRRIVIVGAGGLGVSCLWGLIAGWRTSEAATPEALEILVIDDDRIEVSNLNRQVFFTADDLGKSKAEMLCSRAQALLVPSDRQISLQSISKRLAPNNIDELLSGVSLVLDATDSVDTKLLINDYCTVRGIPFCYGAAVGFRGQLLLVDSPSRSACLRCLFDNYSERDFHALQQSCTEAGILGSIVGTIGFYQAQEAINFLRHKESVGSARSSRLIRLSLTNPKKHTAEVAPSVACPLGCGLMPERIDLTDKKCPATFLYTKIALEKLTLGGALEVTFSNSQSAENVARSCVEEGYLLFTPARQISAHLWQLLIEKPRNFQPRPLPLRANQQL